MPLGVGLSPAIGGGKTNDQQFRLSFHYSEIRP